MEENNTKPLPNKEENAQILRLQAIAEMSGLTADQLLDKFEKSQAKDSENNTSDNRSIGSQSQSVSDTFDPTGNEFLKGIWGR